ncbi:MAG TPA: hypothetical protein VNQ76_20225 [Planctomicrobium sp.]|nr:hypothetical protein [Planctomicrobium sp.]
MILSPAAVDFSEVLGQLLVQSWIREQSEGPPESTRHSTQQQFPLDRRDSHRSPTM